MSTKKSRTTCNCEHKHEHVRHTEVLGWFMETLYPLVHLIPVMYNWRKKKVVCRASYRTPFLTSCNYYSLVTQYNLV